MALSAMFRPEFSTATWINQRPLYSPYANKSLNVRHSLIGRGMSWKTSTTDELSGPGVGRFKPMNERMDHRRVTSVGMSRGEEGKRNRNISN